MNKVVYILMGCAGIAMIAFLVIKEVRSDDQAPVITFDENIVVTYSAGSDTSVLLNGVQVVDNVDGDVSENLVVENIYDFGNGQIKVSYAAKDEAGNISKAERIIEYAVDIHQSVPVSSEAAVIPEVQNEVSPAGIY